MRTLRPKAGMQSQPGLKPERAGLSCPDNYPLARTGDHSRNEKNVKKSIELNFHFRIFAKNIKRMGGPVLHSSISSSVSRKAVIGQCLPALNAHALPGRSSRSPDGNGRGEAVPVVRLLDDTGSVDVEHISCTDGG